MDFNQIARVLAVLGVVFLVSAGVIYVFSRLDLPLGKLPGDILITRGNFTCAVPLVSSVLISILLTILLNLLISFLRK
jgi:predicted neutral ceramidase superfamily lipid hydrolase